MPYMQDGEASMPTQFLILAVNYAQIMVKRSFISPDLNILASANWPVGSMEHFGAVETHT